MRKFFFFSIFAFFVITTTSSYALTLKFDSLISGAKPGGVAPWLKATFENHQQTVNSVNTAGVLLTLTAPGLLTTPQEFVTKWYFNVDTNIENDLSSLKFLPYTIGTVLAKKNEYEFNANGQNAGSGEKFDIYFEFQSSNQNNNRFHNGDIAEIFLYGVNNLKAESFYALSSKAGNGDGPHYYAAAHVQGLSNGNSGWVGAAMPAPIPEPGTLLLLGSGFIGLAVYRHRKSKV